MSFYQFNCYMNAINDIEKLFAGKGAPKSRKDNRKPDIEAAMQKVGVKAPR